jgi:hypothetical protein
MKIDQVNKWTQSTVLRQMEHSKRDVRTELGRRGLELMMLVEHRHGEHMK